MKLVTAAAVRTATGVLGDSLVIADGRIQAIEASRGIEAPAPTEAYPDGFIVPGLRDAHFHPGTYTAALFRPSLKSAADFVEIGDRLKAAADDLPPGVPVAALRLDDEALAEGRLPTRHDLDAVIADRPVLAHRYCGHVAVANTAALDMAGLGADTPDPTGGSLDREHDGRPNGILRETAVTLVAAAMSAGHGSAINPDQLAKAMQGLATLGLTSIGAIIGCGDSTWAELGDETEILAAAGADIPIKLNVLVIAHSPRQLESAAERISGAGPKVRFLGLKAFGDGSLGGHTAAMHRPFSDRPSVIGTLRLDHDWAVAMTKHSLQMADRVAIHAIGDRANAAVLSAFEEVIGQGAESAALRIEHASVLGREEMDRLERSGVTASVQPAFIASETGWLEKRVGKDRLATTYPFRSLLDRGVPLAGGSDCPVEPPDPLLGMAVARDRCGVVPDEGLDAEDALALFTTGAAAAMAEPEPLSIGAPADFVVLDRDPVSASPDELRSARVLATFVDGEAVPIDDDLPSWTE